MKKLVALSILVFATSYVYAGKPIAKCVNAQGELTYTDIHCVTEDHGNNPMLLTEDAFDSTVHSRIPSVIRADTIVANKIKSATKEAQLQCTQRFVKYFKRKHPAIESVPDIKFTNVVDQYIKGSNVSISLSGSVEYQEERYAVNSNIECTVQRLNASNEWYVGYRER